MGTHDKEIQSGVHTGLGGKPEEEGEGQAQHKEEQVKGSSICLELRGKIGWGIERNEDGNVGRHEVVENLVK